LGRDAGELGGAFSRKGEIQVEKVDEQEELRDGVADGEAGAQGEAVTFQARLGEGTIFGRDVCGPVAVAFFVE